MMSLKNIKFSDAFFFYSFYSLEESETIRGAIRAERSRKDVNEIRGTDAGSIRDNNEVDFYNEDRRSPLGGAAEARRLARVC